MNQAQNQQAQAPMEKEKINQLVLDLTSPDARENALLVLRYLVYGSERKKEKRKEKKKIRVLVCRELKNEAHIEQQEARQHSGPGAAAVALVWCAMLAACPRDALQAPLPPCCRRLLPFIRCCCRPRSRYAGRD